MCGNHHFHPFNKWLVSFQVTTCKSHRRCQQKKRPWGFDVADIADIAYTFTKSRCFRTPRNPNVDPKQGAFQQEKNLQPTYLFAFVSGCLEPIKTLLRLQTSAHETVFFRSFWKTKTINTPNLHKTSAVFPVLELAFFWGEMLCKGKTTRHHSCIVTKPAATIWRNILLHPPTVWIQRAFLVKNQPEKKTWLNGQSKA